eukprot:CAMPEP_0171251482 /NCGR_PEP_ID=MMETSP0790-20130122/50659_1 /TAXON_ID=2925 /ORGANISM="Alexandrium catenella, Strain OF101" /LENGTH=123 /DNA_ID=CAMNT_0011719175 /DNA_START=9 /DNA_END=376 /DNA_ORIENTATION=-
MEAFDQLDSLDQMQRSSRRVRFQVDDFYSSHLGSGNAIGFRPGVAEDPQCCGMVADTIALKATPSTGSATPGDPGTGALEAFIRSWIMEAMKGTSTSVGLSSFVDPADIVELFQQICQSGGLP